jgi:hypothetical protein
MGAVRDDWETRAWGTRTGFWKLEVTYFGVGWLGMAIGVGLGVEVTPPGPDPIARAMITTSGRNVVSIEGDLCPGLWRTRFFT